MVDKADLRNMIMTFRVSELQLLLGLTSQSRYGRKTELLQRALAMVENGVSVPVQLKIRELYQKFTPRVPGTNTTFSVAQNSIGRTTVNTGTIHKGLCELLGQSSQPSSNVTYPQVKFKTLPFYDLLGEILQPVCLAPRSSAKQQETRLSFSLTDQQVQEITMSRIGYSSNRLEYNVQVQLRFCVVDPSSRQPDAFPSNIAVKINGVIAPLPNPIPTNKPGAQAKRPSRPVDVTALCRLSNSINNSITVTWMAEENKNYCMAMYLVKHLDSSLLLQRLKRSGACKPEQTKTMVREKLSLDCDAELATTSLRVSLRCPLGKVRMKLPCRAAICNHLQCFDAETFLQMNEKKPTWVCPICDRPAEFNKLVIDGLFLQIIRHSPDSTEIELTKDGRWHVTGTEDIDENSCGSPKPEIQDTQGGCSKPYDGDVIDLTESGDEANYPCDSKSHLHALTKTYASSAQSKCSTVSSPSASSPHVTIYDLSPLNFPVPSPHRQTLSPDLVSDLSPQLPPPPLAHCNYQPFALSSKLHAIPPTVPPILSTTAFGGFPLAGSLHSPFSGLYGGGFDGLMPSDVNMMELFSLMSSMPEYSLAHQQLAFSSGLFDYLYQPRAESSLDGSSHHSPHS